MKSCDLQTTLWSVPTSQQVNTVRIARHPVWQQHNIACWVSRLLLIGALFASTWCIAGYYPDGRFITLLLVALALGASFFAPVVYTPRGNGLPTVLVVGLLAVLFGAAQLLPLGNVCDLVSPGIAETRAEFSAFTSSDDSLPYRESLRSEDEVRITASRQIPASRHLSISRWETKTAVSTLMIGLVGLTLGWLLFSDNSSRMVLLIGFTLCGAAEVFWGIVQQVAHPDQIVWGHLNPGQSSPFGSFLNRNHAADMLGMSIGCALGLLAWCYSEQIKVSARSYGKKTVSPKWMLQPSVLATCLLLGWLLFGLVLTLSRGGWLSFAISIIGVGIIWTYSQTASSPVQKSATRGSAIRLATFVSLVTTAFLLFAGAGLNYTGLLQRVGKRLNSLDVETMTSDVRFDHWIQAFPAAIHYLSFGSGLGTYGYAHLPFTEPSGGRWFSHAHNQYLEVFVEAGVPGIMMILAAIVLSVLSSRRLLKHDRTPSEQAIGIAALVAVVMQATHAMGEFGSSMPANLLGLSMLMGAGLSGAVARRASMGNPISSQRMISMTYDESSKRFSFASQLLSVSVGQPFHWAILVGVLIVPSLIHLRHCVHIERELQATNFTSLTPAPSVEDAMRDINRMTDLIDRFPDAQRPRLRRARLRIHLVQRKTYDNLLRQVADPNQESDKRELWRMAGLDNAIFVMHQHPSTEFADAFAEIRSELATQLAEEMQLSQAWNELAELLVINPMLPQAHLLITKVAAASGRPWDHHFRRMQQLCSGDPDLSFEIGLLAMSAGDHGTMLRHWKQTIEFDPQKMETIVQVARQRVPDDVVVNQLFPENWAIPYGLSLKLKQNDADRHFHDLLLRRASQLIVQSDLGAMDRFRAQFQVANQMGDFSAAAEWMLKAVQLEPRDPDLRYQAANALVKSERLNEAEDHIRIGTGLAPLEQRYKRLLSSLRRRDH